MKFLAITLALVAIAAACSATSDAGDADAEVAGRSPAATESGTDGSGEVPAPSLMPVMPREFPPAPTVPDGPLDPGAAAIIESILDTLAAGIDSSGVAGLAAANDARVTWVISDFLRFLATNDPITSDFVDIAEALTGATFDRSSPWRSVTDHLIAWDLPAPPDYRLYKAQLFTTIDPAWEFVFSDPDATIDYRLLGWGGVRLDDRELGDPFPCVRGCIPSLDDPVVTPAAEGGWYPDEAIVFGVEINGESLAFPKNIMEVHEMVNMTLGGRRIGMPYCTLCGSAQVYFTDDIAGLPVERPIVLRTSGLLVRSNKVMYDLDTQSVFDTFTGEAVSGPLREAGVTLEQATVITTRWADWKETHPDTAIIAEDGGIGSVYRADPLGGRDDDGPIFPIGQVDARLAIQEPVLGVTLPDGTAVAFPVATAHAAAVNGEIVEIQGVQAVADGEGLRAEFNGQPIATHQAFWFAWSQFHPDTLLWVSEG